MFTPAERAVFRYAALPGSPERGADPLAARRALLEATAGRLNELLDRAEKGQGAEQAAAEAQVVAAARAAFGLALFDPEKDWTAPDQGWTDAQALELLDHFLGWLSEQADAGRELLAGSSAPTASGPPADPSASPSTSGST